MGSFLLLKINLSCVFGHTVGGKYESNTFVDCRAIKHFYSSYGNKDCKMIELILAIALEVGVPGNFALAIALTENPGLDPLAVNRNKNGTEDRGIMQLNSGWFKGDWGDWEDPIANIRAGCEHIKMLMRVMRIDATWWELAVAYNAGHNWQTKAEAPPARATVYADMVVRKWEELGGRRLFVNRRTW